MKRILIAGVFVFFILSCDSGRLFEQNTEFNDRTWKISQPVEYEFQIQDISKKYNLYYNIRNNLDYPYSRIFVNYNLTDSAGNEISRKLVSDFLFDQKTGKPFGDSGLGDVFDHQFPLLKEYQFRFPGKYKIKFEQFMRQDTLKGVLAAGFRLEAKPTN